MMLLVIIHFINLLVLVNAIFMQQPIQLNIYVEQTLIISISV